MSKEYLLEMHNITKKYPGVIALDDVDFQLEPGQVHALVGANGAGKSTLVNIIAGVVKPTEGKILMKGKKVEIDNEKCAEHLGISTVYQERSLVPGMSVANNVFATRQPVNKLGLVNERILERRTAELLKRLRMDATPGQLVEELSSSKQQLVEIAKALSLEANILILDEPTATITTKETRILFEIIKELKEKGISILYISHRLEEIFEIADVVTIFRDGKKVGSFSINEIEMNGMIQHMVGQNVSLANQEQDTRTDSSQRVLEVNNLSRKPSFDAINFHLNEGEILGFAGLVGAGRTEVARAIFGVDPFDTGEIKAFGEMVNIKHPYDAIRTGIGYMSEDRKEQGLFLEMTVAENIAAPNLKKFSKHNWIIDPDINKISREYIQKLKIATPSENQKVLNLSGGNQQKVVLAAWLHINPRILIVDEPTKGIDVGAKAEIYRILREMQKQGTSIIVISSEFKELMAFTDRIIVMWEGQIVGQMPTRMATEESILELSSGLTNKYSI
jgi:ABC-type sugar transport system ATPase subunit